MFSIEIATPAYFGILLNSALSITLSSNNSIFSIRGTDFFSLKSNETFISNEYIRVFIRAPLLVFYTIDGSSSYLRQKYKAITYIRAPLLYFYTIDGLSNVLAEY
jgi:hypothetical protein